MKKIFIAAFMFVSTFISNVLGCFLIGLALGWSIKNSELNSSLIILFTVGFCGGFTTFSSFTQESLTLINNNQLFYFFSYLLLSVTIGILFVYIGVKTSKCL